VLYYLRRWLLETTFQETRLYLGVDGQRQWNDLAVGRTTLVRLGLFSLVALGASHSAKAPSVRKKELLFLPRFLAQ
jgi:hypothetical protein